MIYFNNKFLCKPLRNFSHSCRFPPFSGKCFWIGHHLSFSVCRHEVDGCWTVRDCMVVYRNTSHVRCQCQRLGTFGVLMDSSQREVRDLLEHYAKTNRPRIFIKFSRSRWWQWIIKSWRWRTCLFMPVCHVLFSRLNILAGNFWIYSGCLLEIPGN